MGWGKWEWSGGGVEGLREGELFGCVGGWVWGGLVCSLTWGFRGVGNLIKVAWSEYFGLGLYRDADWVGL